MKIRILPAAFLIVMMSSFLPRASALVLWNLDNNANQTDPGGGLPWDTVARIAGPSLSLSSTTGSAIHLGGGYMLTANHVTLTANQTITFDGVTSFAVDMTFNGGNGSQQVASGVDMKVFKLTSIPLVGAATLASSQNLNSSATVVGYGVGRGTAALGNSTVDWGNTTTLDTVAKRWGVNVPRQLTVVSGYQALVSVAGASSGFPAGLGNPEAGLTLMDSGSAMFQNISGNWRLVGVGATVSQQAGANTTTFGNDWMFNPSGDQNAHVSVSSYRTQILGIIPEPAPAGLLLGAAGFGVFLFFRRSRPA